MIIRDQTKAHIDRERKFSQHLLILVHITLLNSMNFKPK